MTFIRLTLISILIIPGLTLLGQDDGGEDKFKDAFEEGNKLIEEGIYDQALKEFKQCVKIKPNNANVNYKVGYCYIETNKNKKEALSYLAKAVKDITSRYNPYSHNEDQAPPKARYYFGRALHLNMLLDSAISVYNRFQEDVPKNHIFYSDADRQIDMCKYAKKQVRNRKNIKIKNIGETINTRYHEYSPVISVDENVMYFTSRRPPEDVSKPPLETDGLPFESIYASYKDRNGEWQKPERLDFNSNTRHDAVSSTSPDGQKLFIFRSGKGNGDLYQSRLQGPNEWSEPEPMGSDINTENLEPHGVLSPDGKTFYFVSDRKGGEGGRDIYRVKKLPMGKWSKAQNLGSTINTPYDEDACFIHPDGETMYFSSNGHESMGGYDILFSEKKDNGEWSEPQNMGFPINTVDDDRFFVTSADGKRGYYASEKEDGLGGRDIYEVVLEEGRTEELAVMKGFINVPEDQKMPEKTQVRVTNLSTGKTTLYRPRERDGVFVSILPPCKEYKVEYMVGNRTFKSEKLTIPCEASYQEINKEIYLNPVDLGKSEVVEKGISRDRKWKVLKGGESYSRSDVVVKYIADNGNVMFTESLNEDGTFPYYKLPKQESYRFQIQTDEPHLCQELELLLVDQKGKEMGRAKRNERCNFELKDPSLAQKKGDTAKDAKKDVADKGKDDEKPSDEKDDAEEKPDEKDEDVAAADDHAKVHEQHYDYNKKGLDKGEADYQAFMKKVDEVIKKNGKAKITITGSASKVPTKTYDSNRELAKLRAEKAKEQLKKHLESRNVPMNNIEFEVHHQVNGPGFGEGNIKSKQVYMEHQYVRLEIQ